MQIFLGVLGKGGGAQTRCILGAVQVANKRVPKDNDNSERLDYKSLEPLSHASKFCLFDLLTRQSIMNIQYPIVTLQ